MSHIRQAIKSKLKIGEKSHEKHTEEEMQKAGPSTEEMKTLRENNDNDQDDVASRRDDVSINSMDDLDVQDLSTSQLHEQLLSVMIQNQELERTVKEQERIQELYDHERAKCKALEQQLRDFVKQASAPARAQGETEEGFIDVAQEVQEDTQLPQEPDTWRGRFSSWFVNKMQTLIQDFTDDPDVDELGEDEQLSIKKLRGNITRFKEDTDPIFCTISGLKKLFSWEYPTSTAVTFMLYMYAVWLGWLLPLILFSLILRLSINYLNFKGWGIRINLLAAYEEHQSEPRNNSFSDKGVSDKLNVVLQVATKVQSTLGFLADNLEKLWNLFTWQQPEATIQLYMALVLAFCMACVLPGATFFKVAGLYYGFKMFVVEFLYMRFPRFKHRHDTLYILWQGLPTNAMLKRQHHQDHISSKSLDAAMDTVDGEREDHVSENIRSFCDIFSLPYDEQPLQDWQDGKGCALIDREKGLRQGFKYGKLFLTKSFLCYERHKKRSLKNLLIPLADITEIKKVELFSWLPGTGMAIEISIKEHEKPYLFGAILSRDEVFEILVGHGVSANLVWAKAAWDAQRGSWKGSKDSVRSDRSASEESTMAEKTKDKEAESTEENEETADLRQRLVRMSDLQTDD